jgi:hypothetical protein
MIFRRRGVDFADSTLCDWVRDMADLLKDSCRALVAGGLYW